MTAAAILAFNVDEKREPRGRIPGNHGIWVGITCEFVEFLVPKRT